MAAKPLTAATRVNTASQQAWKKSPRAKGHGNDRPRFTCISHQNDFNEMSDDCVN